MTDNQRVNILKEVKKFKFKMNNKYGLDINVFVKKDTEQLSLEAIEACCVRVFNSKFPLLENVHTISKRLRTHYYVMLRQIFCYIAVKEYGYGLTETGRYLLRNHATVIHSIKVCENYMFQNHREFTDCMMSVKYGLKKYVGNISENSTGENNSESDVSIIQHERKDSSIIAEV
jgi:chromosomal replication initiation ATPase DnaA